MNIMQIIWEFAQSGPGLMVIGTMILFILNYVYKSKPGWAKYEGWMITAAKSAEKWIPNDTDNDILSKADKALDIFVKAYTKAKGKSPNKKLINEVIQGFPIVHDKLEQNGTLSKKKK